MHLCQVCGNEIPKSCGQCRFCGSPQRRPKARGPGAKERVRTVNLEAGMPPAAEGCRRLEAALYQARQEGVQVLRVIHGWGSSGTGGKLREACRGLLNRKMAEGQVKQLIRGEDYSGSSRAGKEMAARYPGLQRSGRLDWENPGITIVIL